MTLHPLSTGQLIVTDPTGYSIVDLDGQVLKSFSFKMNLGSGRYLAFSAFSRYYIVSSQYIVIICDINNGVYYQLDHGYCFTDIYSYCKHDKSIIISTDLGLFTLTKSGLHQIFPRYFTSGAVFKVRDEVYFYSKHKSQKFKKYDGVTCESVNLAHHHFVDALEIKENKVIFLSHKKSKFRWKIGLSLLPTVCHKSGFEWPTESFHDGFFKNGMYFYTNSAINGPISIESLKFVEAYDTDPISVTSGISLDFYN